MEGYLNIPENGDYCFDKPGEWFIVGIDTPVGSYTYHYKKEYFDILMRRKRCEEYDTLSNDKQ